MSSLLAFYPEALMPQDDKISSVELCKVHHKVKHHRLYRTVDCGTEVDQEIYDDSAVPKRHDKDKALCENVLAPYTIQMHPVFITENELHHSTSTEASNKDAFSHCTEIFSV